jgi:hypothetical protein
MRDFFKASPALRITLAALTFIVGFFKFISVTKGDIPVPAISYPQSAYAAGTALFLDYYKENSVSFSFPVRGDFWTVSLSSTSRF